jgi:hypothetical protein
MKIIRNMIESPDYMEKVLDAILTDLTALKTSLDSANAAITELMTVTDNTTTHLTEDGIITPTVLDPGSTTHQIESTAFTYRIDGMPYAKAAVTAGTAFSAANTINTGAAAGIYWGVWLVQINAAGTISTKPGGGLADQVYTSEALAIAALPAADAGNVAMGYLTIACTTDVDWVAQTDDIVSGSDNTSVTFYPAAATVPSALTESTPTSVGTLTTTT